MKEDLNKQRAAGLPEQGQCVDFRLYGVSEGRGAAGVGG